MTKKIDAVYGSEQRAREVTVKAGPLGVGVYGGGKLLVSAPAEALCVALLEASTSQRCKRWLALIAKV